MQYTTIHHSRHAVMHICSSMLQHKEGIHHSRHAVMHICSSMLQHKKGTKEVVRQILQHILLTDSSSTKHFCRQMII